MLRKLKEEGKIDEWGTDSHGDLHNVLYLKVNGVEVYLYKENIRMAALNFVNVTNVSYFTAKSWMKE